MRRQSANCADIPQIAESNIKHENPSRSLRIEKAGLKTAAENWKTALQIGK